MGRRLPEDFEMSLLATGKRFTRTVDRQGRISWKRYRLYVRLELRKEKVEVQEFFDSLVITYQSVALVSYGCSHERSQITSISYTPVFHYTCVPLHLCSMIIRRSRLQPSWSFLICPSFICAM